MPAETQLPTFRKAKQHVPYHRSSTKDQTSRDPPSHILVQCISSVDGLPAAGHAPMLLPADTTHAQLTVLINTLLSQQDDPLPYSFTCNDVEIGKNLLQDIIIPQNMSQESTLSIVYHPQAIFRVNAMTRCSSSLTGHTEAILCVSFSPDGRHLATASGDTTVRLWDVCTETPLATCKGHSHWVQTLSWSPDCRILASGGMDNTVRLWEPKKGEALGGPLKGHTQCITAMAFEPMHLNKECHRFASSSKDGTVKVWNAILRTCIYTLSQHTGPVMCLKWGGEGVLYTGSRDKTIKMWDAKDGKLIRSLEGHAHWINHLALSTDHLLRTGPYDPDVKKKSGTFMTFSSRQQAYEAALKRYQAYIASHPEKECLVSCSDDYTLYLWKPLESKKPVTRMTGHQQVVNQVTFSPDGRWIASASFDKSVKLWDARTGKFITTLRGHVGAVYQVAFSPDSRLLLSASKDSTCKVWNLKTKALCNDLPGHADEVFTVDWCPMGWGGASGGKDRCLKMYVNVYSASP